MSAAIGQVAAFVAAVRMMSSLKSAWKRAHADGVRLWQVPDWLAYYGGMDPHKDARCADCRKPLTDVEREKRMECCMSCWAARIAATRAPRRVGMRFEP